MNASPREEDGDGKRGTIQVGDMVQIRSFGSTRPERYISYTDVALMGLRAVVTGFERDGEAYLKIIEHGPTQERRYFQDVPHRYIEKKLAKFILSFPMQVATIIESYLFMTIYKPGVVYTQEEIHLIPTSWLQIIKWRKFHTPMSKPEFAQQSKFRWIKSDASKVSQENCPTQRKIPTVCETCHSLGQFCPGFTNSSCESCAQLKRTKTNIIKKRRRQGWILM
mmetsp:Transcript_1545/g.2213  ORF Transcript_1545/g.2213 Transcript_1545/m.2213 type:complete len:223 (-) Transcript_1545:737-1405(-)